MFDYLEETANPLQAGVTVSSRNFKKAVQRNRVKRILREAYRLQKNELRDKLKLQQRSMAVFFVYTGNELPQYEFVFEKTGKVLNRLKKIIDENSLANP